MIMAIIKFIIVCVGFTVCLAAGLALAGCILGMAVNYTWRKVRAAHSMMKLQRAVKAYREDV
ncbi:hypothetical protein AB0175_25030 [Klebsiella pneumoniae]|nr:hypothetical protein [Klebsiella pneumoniae subsp. ozaenae]HDH0770450.1 hypothetical protein [Klebsiella pneumoniae]